MPKEEQDRRIAGLSLNQSSYDGVLQTPEK